MSHRILAVAPQRTAGSLGFSRCASTSLALLLLALLLPASARAQGAGGVRRVVVLGLEPVGVSGRLARRLTRIVRNEVAARADLVLVAKDAVSLGEAVLSFSCVDETPDCLSMVGEEMGAQLLVFGHLRRAGAGRELALQALDVATKSPLGSVRRSLPPGEEDLVAAQLTAELLQAPSSTPQTQVTLTILQAGARIYVDGRLVAQAPLSLPLLVDPGRHEIEVALEGYEEWTREVTMRPGAALDFEVNLEPLQEPLAAAPPRLTPAPAPAPMPPPPGEVPSHDEQPGSTRKIMGWSLLGGGVALAGLGGVFAAAMLRTQDQFDAETYHRKSNDLAAEGNRQALAANILLGVGGALAVSGGLLLLAGGDDGGAASTSATPPDAASRWANLRLWAAPTADGFALSLSGPLP